MRCKTTRSPVERHQAITERRHEALNSTSTVTAKAVLSQNRSLLRREPSPAQPGLACSEGGPGDTLTTAPGPAGGAAHGDDHRVHFLHCGEDGRGVVDVGADHPDALWKGSFVREAARVPGRDGDIVAKAVRLVGDKAARATRAADDEYTAHAQAPFAASVLSIMPCPRPLLPRSPAHLSALSAGSGRS